MAHALLLRTNTAPTFPSSNSSTTSSTRVVDRSSHQQSTMSSAPRTSQLSGSTAFAGSSASLNSLASSTSTITPSPNGGPIVATANIINQKADASRSLYQICISLKSRLTQVPEFQPLIDALDPSDPVDPLWNLFRRGYPLLLIYNALQPEVPLKVDDPNASEAKKSKIAIFKFIQACMKDLKLPPAETFVITDLMGEDTTGFVKVTQVVNYVLDLAEQGGHLLQVQPADEAAIPVPGTQMSYRDHIIKELVDTERKYVQDLENLHDLKKALEQKGTIPGDTIHSIFLNINAILDFQRRFLIRVEHTNSMPKDLQRWGASFCLHETSFNIYQPFISNQRKAAQIANQIFDKIQMVQHPVAMDFNTLDGFLLKPMQRLVKYPLLLKDLNKKTEDEEIKEDLTAGCEAAERVLHKANEAVNRDLLDEAVEDLITRVDDWKSHKVEQFGRLILHGVYGVLTGKADQEKDYEIYLFDCILLCCKEKKDRSTRSVGPKVKNNKSAKLQLKGRIFMTNVTDIVSLSKPGSHSVQIWWKGDPGVENFTIKFLNEETMKKWAACLETQRKENAPRASISSDSMPSDFIWNQNNAGGLENPYLQGDDDDEDYPSGSSFPIPPGSAMPRTSSSSSMRQRSATMESQHSLNGVSRAPPPRFPLPAPPGSLNVQTQVGGASSPGLRGGDSYFSPIADSPASSRTSTTSGIFPGPAYQFPPKTSHPQQPGWDENSRYTAPAMPRAPSRDGTPPNSMNGRHPRGPSLPAMASSSQSAAQQQRSRSYSTTDAGISGVQRQRHPSQSNVPTVPSIPSHLAHDPMLARSQSGSPRNDLPIRANTNSPGRGHGHSGSVGGSMGQFPVQPLNARQNTSGSVGNIRTVSPSSPALPSGPMPNGGDMPLPTQLKVRVNCDAGNYVTLVVGFNITYQSLIDRIDAKLNRFMNTSIGKGELKLRYQDEDGDFVTIESDDDIQIAFMEWREGMRNMYAGGVGEIELFCSSENVA